MSREEARGDSQFFDISCVSVSDDSSSTALILVGTGS